jgi:RimJ/RimL family protein N-acetyltransferase
VAVTFEESVDYQLIKSVVDHPAVRRSIRDDFAASEDWQPVIHPTVRYLLCRDGDEVLGLFVVVFVSAVLFLIHLMFLPSAWGERSRRALKEGIELLWNNSKCQRITGEVLETNIAALKAMTAAGFETWGVNRKSAIKGGRLVDVYHVGLSRPEAE